MSDALICGSTAMQSLIGRLDRLAAMDAKTSSPANVVIHGETGAGKDLVARRIHERSGRGCFVAINCSAVPEDLFESELFGHERGAFTGAIAKKKGLFEEAEGGTLFLDEAADLPVGLQVKLLRALQNRVIRRVGGLVDIPIDVRVIVASNRGLAELVEAGEFRRDLYYRLNVFSVTVPPLRERADDIVPLVEHFCARHAEKYGVPRKAVSPEALDAFGRHAWPGNVRELEHVIEHAYIVAQSDVICMDDVAEKVPRPPLPTLEERAEDRLSRDEAEEDLCRWIDRLPADLAMPDLKALLRAAKKLFCEKALVASGGNIAQAARTIALDRRSFYRLVKGVPGDDGQDEE